MCPTNFSLSWRYDKLKLIGHQTEPLFKLERLLTVPARSCSFFRLFYAFNYARPIEAATAIRCGEAKS